MRQFIIAILYLSLLAIIIFLIAPKDPKDIIVHFASPSYIREYKIISFKGKLDSLELSPFFDIRGASFATSVSSILEIKNPQPSPVTFQIGLTQISSFPLSYAGEIGLNIILNPSEYEGRFSSSFIYSPEKDVQVFSGSLNNFKNYRYTLEPNEALVFLFKLTPPERLLIGARVKADLSAKPLLH